jgi:hypothetical protein
VADFGSGLRVVDVSNPAAPTEVGSYDTPANAHDVAVADGRAFVANHSSGLRVVDVSNPSAPTEVGSYDTPGNPWGVSVADGYTYVADGTAGLSIVAPCSGVFSDDFESANVAAWSSSQGYEP